MLTSSEKQCTSKLEASEDGLPSFFPEKKRQFYLVPILLFKGQHLTYSKLVSKVRTFETSDVIFKYLAVG